MKSSGTASIASDSRITLVSHNNDPIRWFDDSNFKKNIILDGVIYGFAGTNAFFQYFLEMYESVETSVALLDVVIKSAQSYGAQIFILRYDGEELRLFANSPASVAGPEIYKVSTDKPIDQSYYAIGSGKDSKQYKKNKLVEFAQTPIIKIISANNTGLKKKNLLHLDKKAKEGTVTREEARAAIRACQHHGGDLFTGGEITMNNVATKEFIAEQLKIAENLNEEAKSLSSVCASPINANLEVKHLRSSGHAPISEKDFEMTSWHKEKLEKLNARISGLI